MKDKSSRDDYANGNHHTSQPFAGGKAKKKSAKKDGYADYYESDLGKDRSQGLPTFLAEHLANMRPKSALFQPVGLPYSN